MTGRIVEPRGTSRPLDWRTGQRRSKLEDVNIGAIVGFDEGARAKEHVLACRSSS